MMKTSNTASITVQDRDIFVNRTTVFTKKGIFVEFQFYQQNYATKIGHHPLVVHLSVAVNELRNVCTEHLCYPLYLKHFVVLSFIVPDN